MNAAEKLAPKTGVAAACRAFAVSRASLYRRRRGPGSPRRPRRCPRRITDVERRQVLDLLHSERFVDRAPAEVYATLLDDGQYLCSERSMYRILGENGEVRERRAQLRRPNYEKPELLATGPNQVWSWDITKLKGPRTWTCFHLYVILDIFSRYVTGWVIAERESTALAERLIRETVEKQNVQHGELTVHADRGPAMRSKPVAQLLADLGITKTHNRPHVSNDNPFSESQFKTLKYHPGFPDRFGSLEDGRAFARPFFDWYNHEHRHGGIAMLTPGDVHYGRADQVVAARRAVLKQACQRHPERFVRGCPTPRPLPNAVWINPPTTVRASTSNAPFATNLDTEVSHSC